MTDYNPSDNILVSSCSSGEKKKGVVGVYIAVTNFFI